MGIFYKCDFCGNVGELNSCDCRIENYEFLRDNRDGRLVETFFHAGIVYEKLLKENDAFTYTAMFVKSGIDQRQQVVLSAIDEEEYQIYRKLQSPF